MNNDLIAKAAIDRRMAEIITPVIEDMGFELVRVRLMSGKSTTLQVMADRPDGGIEVDELALISQSISAVMDVEDPILDEYTLEVSSPGIDRPLTRGKDFANWAGHEVKISMAKGYDGQRNLRGELKGIEGDTVAVEDRKAGEVFLPRDQIHSAKLVLTDELIAATQPLDTSGADDIEEEKADD